MPTDIGQRVAKDEPAVQAPASDDETARYDHARQMIRDAIDAHIGGHGGDLVARLAHTTGARDLHALVPDFARALVRQVGLEPATPIITSIERLITGA
jgi:hypothetical protein